MPAGLADQWREGTRYGPPVTGAVVVFGVRGQGVAGDRARGEAAGCRAVPVGGRAGSIQERSRKRFRPPFCTTLNKFTYLAPPREENPAQTAITT